ncbi:MAG: cytochrome P450 [Acidobacteria bacterium]|nr:cytochrome P450 [Acidobacteriota bacterium]
MSTLDLKSNIANLKSASPPGPKAHWLTGVMRDYQNDPLGFATRCAREFGDIVSARFLYVPCFFIYHPDHIEQVLVTQQRNFIKSVSLQTPFMRRLIGNGLLSSEGEFWKRQRRLAQPAFHRERINTYSQTMTAYTERMLASWQTGETRDIHEDMMQLTLEIVAKTLFDADVTDTAREVGQLLSVIVEPFSYQASFKWILDNRLPTPMNRRFHRTAQRLDEIVFGIINERRASKVDRGDLLSMLLAALDEDGSQMTDQQLRDEAMTLFLAGHETTALTMSWTWYLLAQHPEVEAKLRAEIESVLGERTPTMADLPALKYADQIIKESMRLYPPAYAMGRQALQEFELGGYRIPAKSQIFFFQYVTHRDPRFFDEPEQFKPERWTEEFVRQLPRYAYFPFGGGPRLCIGNSFAMMETVLILVAIAQKFSLKLAPGQAITPIPGITLRPENGIKMILEKR